MRGSFLRFAGCPLRREKQAGLAMITERFGRILAVAKVMTIAAAMAAMQAVPHPHAAHAAAVPDSDQAEADQAVFDPVRLAGPFEYPWSLAFLPDGSMLIAERAGRLQLVRPGGQAREVAGLPKFFALGHTGFMDVAVDPGFARNRTIFLVHSFGDEKASSLRVLRARLDLNRRRLTDHRIIFESAPAEAATEQLGGRLAVTGDGHLFLTLGDRWKPEKAQKAGNHLGSIVRIRTDGTVPPDNPLVGVEGARPEIWSYGHRNPQGLALDGKGQLWSHEHGPMGGDELNLILPGRNYGWPVITYGIGYDGKPVGEGSAKEGMEQPFYPFDEALAPSGLAIEDAGTATVFWIGTLAGQTLLRIQAEDGRIVDVKRLLREELGRIRDVRLGPDGLLYLLTDDAEGALYRLDPILEQAGQGRGNGRL